MYPGRIPGALMIGNHIIARSFSDQSSLNPWGGPKLLTLVSELQTHPHLHSPRTRDPQENKTKPQKIASTATSQYPSCQTPQRTYSRGGGCWGATPGSELADLDVFLSDRWIRGGTSSPKLLSGLLFLRGRTCTSLCSVC